MPTQLTRWTTLLVVFLLLFTFLPTSVLGQNGPQTYTTDDGLSFDYPDGWGLHSMSSQVFLSSNASATSRSDLDADDAYAIVMSDENLAGLFGHFDNLDAAAQLVSSIFTAGVEGLTSETLEVSGNPAIRYDFEDDTSHSVMMFVDIDGKIVAVIVTSALDEFDAQEATLLGIIESMRYDVGSETAVVQDTPTTPISSDVNIVWQRQYEISDYFFGALGTVLYLSTNGDSIYLSDSANIMQLGDDGNIVAVHGADTANFFSVIAADNDGTIWAGTFEEKVFVHIGQDGSFLSGWSNDDFESPIFGDVIAITDLAKGPDDNLYIFTTRYDEAFNGDSYILVWSNTGEFLYDFMVSDTNEIGQRFVFDTYISFTPEGNLLLVDRYGDAKVVDREGNIVKDDFPVGFGQDIYVVNDAVVGLDGSIYVASYDGIHRFSAESVPLETFGTIQEYSTDPPEFTVGEFSALGPTGLAVMSNGDIIAIDSNETYNLIVRLDFGANEGD